MIRLTLTAACVAMLGACATTEHADHVAAAPAARPAPAPAAASLAAAKTAGEGVFNSTCARCHNGQGRPPAPGVLAAMDPNFILTALTTGKMAPQGRTLTDEQKTQVATYLTGKAPA